MKADLKCIKVFYTNSFHLFSELIQIGNLNVFVF